MKFTIFYFIISLCYKICYNLLFATVSSCTTWEYFQSTRYKVCVVECGSSMLKVSRSVSHNWNVFLEKPCTYMRNGLVERILNCKNVRQVGVCEISVFWHLDPCSLVGIDGRIASIIRRWLRQYAPLKRRSAPTTLHGAISQKTFIFK
jgi:hypothetical protein